VRVYLEGTRAGDPVGAFTIFGNAAVAAGYQVMVEDPVALASGAGRLFVDVPHVETSEDAVAVVRALLDQVPGAGAAFVLSPGQD
jgi:hypothetical protein